MKFNEVENVGSDLQLENLIKGLDETQIQSIMKHFNFESQIDIASNRSKINDAIFILCKQKDLRLVKSNNRILAEVLGQDGRSVILGE